jgi:hypothetical protein
MADYITSGGATLSVNASDTRHQEIIMKTISEVGGTVIASTNRGRNPYSLEDPVWLWVISDVLGAV